MADRRDDVSYWSARLVQELCETCKDGSHSAGIWNVDRVLTEQDSHGDAGVMLINCANNSAQCFGGYLQVDDKSGHPYIPVN